MNAFQRFITSSKWSLHIPVLRSLLHVVARQFDGEKLDGPAIAKIVESRNTALHAQDVDEDLRVVSGDVSLIPIKGIIARNFNMVERASHLGTTTGEIQRAISQATMDTNTPFMVLDIDSPGGELTGIPETGRAILNARDKGMYVVASITGIGASAGYWLAAMADEVWITDVSEAGSIGVVTLVIDSTESLRQQGLEPYIVASGELKGGGMPGAPVTRKVLAAIKQSVDEGARVFVEAVATGRNMSVSAVRALADGRLYMGNLAVLAGLADHVGELPEAIEAARRATQTKRGTTSRGVALHGATVMDPGQTGGGGGVVSTPTAPNTPAIPPAQPQAAVVPAALLASVPAIPPTPPAAPPVVPAVPPLAQPIAPPVVPAVPPVALAIAPPVVPAVPPLAQPIAPPVVPTEPPVALAIAPPVVPAPAAAPGHPGPPQSPPGTQLAYVPAPPAGSPVPVAPAYVPQVAMPAASVYQVADQTGLGADFARQQIEAAHSPDQVNAAALEALAARNTPIAIQVGVNNATETFAEGMRDHLLARTGFSFTESEPRHERAAEFAGMSMVEMCRAHINAWGTPTTGLPRDAVCRLALRPQAYMPSGAMMAAAGVGVMAHSTSDFPMILRDATNKTLLKAYTASASTWQVWMRRRTAPDFKTIREIKFGDMPDLALVKEGGEYFEGTIAEDEETWVLLKFGRLISFTWEAMINDDLDAFGRLPALHGAAARRRENLAAYLPIINQTNGENMADGNPLFHTSHNNIIASGGPPSVTQLGLTRALMKKQTGVGGTVKIAVTPRYLLVPSDLETVSDQLLGSDVDPALSNATPNPFKNKLQTLSEPLLDLDAGYAGSSNAKWMLVSQASEHDNISVCFLEGNEQPFLEEQDGRTIDGRSWKVRHVVAAKAVDHRGVAQNNGA